MKTAVIIGHDKTSPGAYSKLLHQSEYIYNSEVSSYLSCVADVYKRPLGGGYTAQMRKLAEILNPKNYDLVIELHFNSFNGEAHGCEALIFPRNEFTYNIGMKFCKSVTEKYDTHNRMVKEVREGGRGYGFLSLMEAPAIILEPFFGDNEESLKFENPGKYAEVIKELICS